MTHLDRNLSISSLDCLVLSQRKDTTISLSVFHSNTYSCGTSSEEGNDRDVVTRKWFTAIEITNCAVATKGRSPDRDKWLREVSQGSFCTTDWISLLWLTPTKNNIERERREILKELDVPEKEGWGGGCLSCNNRMLWEKKESVSSPSKPQADP